MHNVINMGSYNYLGFAENDTDFLKTVADTTRQYGIGVSGTRQEMGEWRAETDEVGGGSSSLSCANESGSFYLAL